MPIPGCGSGATDDELVPPLMWGSVIDEDVHAIDFVDLERWRIPHESAVVPASNTRDEHPLSRFHGHIVPPANGSGTGRSGRPTWPAGTSPPFTRTSDGPRVWIRRVVRFAQWVGPKRNSQVSGAR